MSGEKRNGPVREIDSRVGVLRLLTLNGRFQVIDVTEKCVEIDLVLPSTVFGAI